MQQQATIEELTRDRWVRGSAEPSDGVEHASFTARLGQRRRGVACEAAAATAAAEGMPTLPGDAFEGSCGRQLGDFFDFGLLRLGKANERQSGIHCV